MEPIKLAIIGAGAIGQKHIKLAQTNSDCQLVAICDTDPKGQELAEDYGASFYQDYQKMLDQVTLEGVIVATPTDQHAIVGTACVERGLHILVEKPITATVEDGRRLLDVATKHQAQVLVGHHRRFNPLVQRAREIIQNGHLGRLVSVALIWCVLKPVPYYDVLWRTKFGGGPVLINLIHEIDLLRHICGEIKSVYAAASSALRGFEVEDSVSVTLHFENGALGTLLASDATPSPWSYEATSNENPDFYHTEENCLFFMGSTGSLTFPRLEIWRQEQDQTKSWHDPITKNQIHVESSDPLPAQMAHFCRLIRNQEAPVVSGEDGLRTLRATLAILESAHQNRPIDLAP